MIFRRLVVLVVLVLGLAMVGKSHAEVADGYLMRWVERRINQLDPQFGSKPFESIGWAKDLRHAAALAKEHGRPIFLFTLDGHMGSGRC